MVEGSGLGVRELCESIEAVITGVFPDEVWVHGVISDISRSAQGHVYFNLVEAGDLGEAPDAILPVALFNAARQRVNAILRRTRAARIENGTEVKIRGAVRYYPRQGRVQLIMSLIDPAYTLGQVELARAELLARLATEGLLERNRRLALPAAPLRVALVTSAGSAAAADFTHELGHSGYAFAVRLFDVRVQGNDAVADITAALAAVADAVHRFDVVALVRGGGARTDLAAFDHEAVARAVADLPLPAVVGIGHEIDSTVVDEVAARSAKTPTACARLLVEEVAAFDRRLEDTARRIHHQVTRRTHHEHQQLGLAAHRLELSGALVAREHEALNGRRARLEQAMRRPLERAAAQLDRAETATDLLDPARALARGWAIVRHHDGALVRSVTQTTPGTRVDITMADGTLGATIRDVVVADPPTPDRTASHDAVPAHGADEAEEAETSDQRGHDT